jgi:chromosome transmission fidelity protein 4
VSDRFAAVCTSLHFLRVFTITGIQRQIFSLPGPVVSMATQGGLILVAYRQGQGLQGEQSLGYWLLDMDKRCRHLVVKEMLPLSPKSTLAWIGFTSSGMPVTYDSTGVIRILHIAGGNAWMPVANLSAHVKGKSDHYWIIGIHGTPPQIR